MLKLSRRRLTA